MRTLFKMTFLFFLLATACSPIMTQVSPNTPIPSVTLTLTPLPTITPAPTMTPEPFSLSGNFAFTEEDKIFVYSAEGEKIRTIQAEGWVSNYKFSQQGKMVAYSAYNKLENDKFFYSYGLKVIGLEDNQKHTMVDGNTRVLYFLWNEAEDRLNYLTLDGFYSISLDGAMEKETLVEFPDGFFDGRGEYRFKDRDFLPSPDGQYLLFQQVNERGEDIFLIDTLSMTIVEIPRNFYCSNRFNWLPDGRHFLCGIQIFNAEKLEVPKLFEFSNLGWARDGNKSIIVKGSPGTITYKQIWSGDLLADNSTLLYTSKFIIPGFDGAVPISPDGTHLIFQEIYPTMSIDGLKNRKTNSVILNTDNLSVTNLITEEGVAVEDKVIWLDDSQSALLVHDTWRFAKNEAGNYYKDPIKVGLYLISPNSLTDGSNDLAPIHSGYSSYILDNDYDISNSDGYIAFMALNSSDTEKVDRFSIFVFNELNLNLKEVVKTKGPQSYSVQWIK